MMFRRSGCCFFDKCDSNGRFASAMLAIRRLEGIDKTVLWLHCMSAILGPNYKAAEAKRTSRHQMICFFVRLSAKSFALAIRNSC